MLKYCTDECQKSLYVKEIPKLLETILFHFLFLNEISLVYCQINETFPVFILHSWSLTEVWYFDISVLEL